jgi:hypothetical protein
MASGLIGWTAWPVSACAPRRGPRSRIKNGTVRYEQLAHEMTAVSYDTGGISKDFL